MGTAPRLSRVVLASALAFALCLVCLSAVVLYAHRESSGQRMRARLTSRFRGGRQNSFLSGLEGGSSTLTTLSTAAAATAATSLTQAAALTQATSRAVSTSATDASSTGVTTDSGPITLDPSVALDH